MEIETLLVKKSKTIDGFAARIIVKRLTKDNQSVIVIEKKFLSKDIPWNTGYIKVGNI